MLKTWAGNPELNSCLYKGILPGRAGTGVGRISTPGFWTQPPVYVQVDAAWISVAQDCTEVNNLTAVDAAVGNNPLYACRVPLNKSAMTKRIKTPRM